MMSAIRGGSIDDEPCLFGEIAKFTRIDPNSSWFNEVELHAADEEDLDRISIPEYLSPNYSAFSFSFFLNSHRFVIEKYDYGKTLSPNQITRYFEKIALSAAIVEEFGAVNVTLVSDHSSLERIYSLPMLKRLTIHIERPNSDDLGDVEDDIEERLVEQNARYFDLTYRSVPNASLEPDHRTRRLSEVAMSNGEVRGEGNNEEGLREVISTKDYPLQHSVQYDPDRETHDHAFNRLAALMNQILS